MKKVLISCFATAFFMQVNAQLTPEITSWRLNTTAATGYNNIPSDVQTVQYSTGSVYISCTCIPGYSIGPWIGLPNTQVPVNENFVYQFSRNPVQNTGTPTTIGGGHIGVWSNGVSIFNAQDAYSYNNQGVWHRDAVYFEGSTFDNCLGHPAPNGEYHTHLHPNCLYNENDSTNHSPIIGYAFDGFPVYGAYAYTDTTGSGPIKRMASSYRLRNITVRTTLPNGNPAPSNGPAVSAAYPLGYFLEDYEYVAGLGDLDERNGRFCVTPEYPNGIYAYFVTIDASLTAVFPYVFYGSYYGVVQSGNTGPMGGHVTISEPTTVYTTTTGINSQTGNKILFHLGENPVGEFASVYFDPQSRNNITARLYDSQGQLLQTISNMQPSIGYAVNMLDYAPGIYFLVLEAGDEQATQKIIKK